MSKSDDFLRGYSRAELDFLQHETEIGTFAWPNPFDPAREPDAGALLAEVCRGWVEMLDARPPLPEVPPC